MTTDASPITLRGWALILGASSGFGAATSLALARAGLDVFVSEPPTGSPLLGAPGIQLTPHLGASTDEAQEKAGVAVAKSVRLALDGELVPDAVNVAGGAIDPSVRPGIPLMEKLGQVFAALADHSFASIDVEVRGEIVAHDVGVLKLAALKGIFSRISSEQVSYVNAPLLAELGTKYKAAFLADWMAGYDRRASFHCHMAWHQAMFALHEGRYARALEIFERDILPSGNPRSAMTDGTATATMSASRPGLATPIAPEPTSASCSMSVTWMSPPVSVMPKTSCHGAPQRSSSSAWRAGGIAEHWITRTRWSRSRGSAGVVSMSTGMAARQ